MNAASSAQRTIAKGRAPSRKSAQHRALGGFENIDWRRVFSAAHQGQALGVLVAARNSTQPIEPCIRAIFAGHHAAGWRASLWIVVVMDGCQHNSIAEIRTLLGAFGEVLTAGARSSRASYRLGMGAIAMHFAEKNPTALVLTSSCLPGVGCVIRERSLRKIYAQGLNHNNIFMPRSLASAAVAV
jgi:hypothetical protein